MAKDDAEFAMQAMLRLTRGTASAAETLRRYAPLADELGADGIDVDIERADLLLSGTRTAVNEESAMRAMARPLLHRFGWREQDFTYSPNVRYAETTEPTLELPATRLVIDRADQELGWEGETHGHGLAPDRTLDIGPAETDVVTRLFVAVAATTFTATAEALRPWLARVEPAAVSVDRGRAALLYLAHGDLRTEIDRLGLGLVRTDRIEADADHVIDTAASADGTTLWLRRGADPVSRHWPGLIEVREMILDDRYPSDI
ncbi:hypothetical protein [Actinoplanes xinjiangensis]|uniref:Uncharacterized protein n=1 Tax=Actinoplanes xinjiangensis TaxID=512350 RepID=A0A316EJL3_9ACTN|nr:hypothetical protein [Actinoplanes xinjiangensis]PWK31705.1 hypothetical protein BC793_13254 [Actinoplanes xinjiangensis]GIF43921.1 hypothetical protein Axi01nite_82320 [Actinoplanes xinjiangensis]